MSEAGPRVFAVVTWGAAGSMWLARLLNGHPSVLCVHAFASQLKRHWGQRLDDHTYLRAIAHQARAYRLAGDVHGIELHGTAKLLEAFGDRLRIATLVRHPVPRLVSQWAVYRSKGHGFYGLSHRRLRWSLPRPQRGRYDSPEKLFFVHVMGLVNRVVQEAEVGPVFTLERLSSDVEEAQRLLAHLSAGELCFPDAVLEAVWREPVNAHTEPVRGEVAPKEAFAELPAWQRDGFAELLRPEARARYEALGFDLSFV